MTEHLKHLRSLLGREYRWATSDMDEDRAQNLAALRWAIAELEASTSKPPEGVLISRSDAEFCAERLGMFGGETYDFIATRERIRTVLRASPAAKETAVAPIVKIEVVGGDINSADFYAPGLPDGKHDLFCAPVGPGEWVPSMFAEPAATPADQSALDEFTTYIRVNYPPNSVIHIHNPDWHAKRIFAAAQSAIKRAERRTETKSDAL